MSKLTSDQLWELSLAVVAWAIKNKRVRWLHDLPDTLEEQAIAEELGL